VDPMHIEGPLRRLGGRPEQRKSWWCGVLLSARGNWRDLRGFIQSLATPSLVSAQCKVHR
jgi:hypothetical protein